MNDLSLKWILHSTWCAKCFSVFYVLATVLFRLCCCIWKHCIVVGVPPFRNGCYFNFCGMIPKWYSFYHYAMFSSSRFSWSTFPSGLTFWLWILQSLSNSSCILFIWGYFASAFFLGFMTLLEKAKRRYSCLSNYHWMYCRGGGGSEMGEYLLHESKICIVFTANYLVWVKDLQLVLRDDMFLNKKHFVPDLKLY